MQTTDLRDLAAAARRRRFRDFYDRILVPAFPDAAEREAPDDLLRLVESAVPPQVHVIAAGDPAAGGVVAEYYPAADCGFVTYIAVDPAARGQGLSRLLIEAALAALADDSPGQPLVLCELQDPDRTPAASAGMDPRARTQVLGKLGFARLDMAYVQPPLGADKPAADWLWLAAHRASLADGVDSVPADRLIRFLEEFLGSLGLDARGDKRFAAMFADLDRRDTVAVIDL